MMIGICRSDRTACNPYSASISIFPAAYARSVFFRACSNRTARNRYSTAGSFKTTAYAGSVSLRTCSDLSACNRYSTARLIFAAAYARSFLFTISRKHSRTYCTFSVYGKGVTIRYFDSFFGVKLHSVRQNQINISCYRNSCVYYDSVFHHIPFGCPVPSCRSIYYNLCGYSLCVPHIPVIVAYLFRTCKGFHLYLGKYYRKGDDAGY